jgi:hypothetical protein
MIPLGMVHRFTLGRHAAKADGLRKGSSLPAAGGADVPPFGMSATRPRGVAHTCRQKPSARMRHPPTPPMLRNLTTALPASTHAGAICNLDQSSMEENHEIS